MALFGAGRAFWMPSGQAMVVNLVPPEVFPTVFPKAFAGEYASAMYCPVIMNCAPKPESSLRMVIAAFLPLLRVQAN